MPAKAKICHPPASPRNEKAAPVLSGNDALQTRLKTLQRLVDRK